MKKNFTILILLAIIGWSAQSQSWVWERFNLDTYHTYGNATTVDNHGNIYVTGHFFSHQITFGNITLSNTDQQNAFPDFYLVKYDPMGNVLWAKSKGGTYYDLANGITTDALGNVYVTGKYASSSIIFGNDTLHNAAQYYYDFFVVKYDSNGNELWARRAGGGLDDGGLAAVTDNLGNVYVTGTFKSNTITFGNFTLNNMGPSYEDIFIVKYDPSGNVLRASRFGGGGADIGTALAIDASNNLYLTGGFSSPSITFGTFTLTLGNSTDNVFVVKMDSAGVVQWANSAGVASYNYGLSVCIDNGNNVFVGGYFRGSTITFGNYTLSNGGANTDDIFLVKYKFNGIVLWAKSAGGINDDFGSAIVTDGSNVYLTGSYSSPTIAFGNFTLTNGGSHDIYIAEYDGSGNTIFAKTVKGFQWDVGSAAAIDANNNVYIAGSFSSDTLIFDTDSLFGSGNYTMFLAKLSTLTTEISMPVSFHERTAIYPNPNNGNFTVNCQLPIVSCQFEIKDISGRIVYTQTLPENSASLTLSANNLDEGIYFWEIVSMEGIQAKGKMAVIR